MAMKRRVAVMIDMEWPLRYHQEVYAGIQRFAEDHGSWDCRIDPYAAATLARSRRNRPAYDGVVGRVTGRLAEQAARLGVPLVNTWNNSPVTDRTPTVVPDQRLAGGLAAKHLLARGLRTFGYLGFRGERNAHQHWAGFAESLSPAGREASRLLVSANYAAPNRAWAAFQSSLHDWIATLTPPVGVFVINDLTCRYLAEALLRKGWTLPHEAALISGYNELTIALSGKPTITGIEWGFERIGYRAAELLDQLLDGAAPPTRPILMPPVEIVPRQSTDVIATRDPVVAAALRYMAEKSHRPIGVADVAAAVSTTRRSLERQFRRELDSTVGREMTRLRLERLKRLLVESDAPIRTLAIQSGFGGPVQMSKVFRQREGVTPGEFRRQRR